MTASCVVQMEVQCRPDHHYSWVAVTTVVRGMLTISGVHMHSASHGLWITRLRHKILLCVAQTARNFDQITKSVLHRAGKNDRRIHLETQKPTNREDYHEE